MGDGRGLDQLVLYMASTWCSHERIRELRTGTFFWEMTTAQSLPRTPRDVMFAAVIALNAYSGS